MTIRATSTMTASISIRSHLWAQWAAIAVEQRDLAREGRKRIEAQHETTGSYEMPLELKPAMISIAAVTHAIEGFLNDFVDACADYPRLKFAENTPQYAKVFESLRAGFNITNHATLYPKLQRVYQELRNPALHHTPGGAAVPHPFFPTHVSHEFATYTVEAADEAVELLAEIFKTCVENPRVELKEVVRWTEQVRVLALGVAS
jgi:hypothetical protein